MKCFRLFYGLVTIHLCFVLIDTMPKNQSARYVVLPIYSKKTTKLSLRQKLTPAAKMHWV